jgi:pyrimidine-specific ribonucleoside hydrolase
MSRKLWVVLFGAFVLVLGGCGGSQHSAATRLIFSTDLALGLINGRFDGPGPAPTDDAYAVALALARPEQFDVRGLVITFGNDKMEPEVRAAQRAMDALDADVPIYEGAAVPLSKPPVRFFDDRPLADWCVNDGVRFMAAELRDAPATIAAIGPFTDIACLAQNFPDEVKRIQRVVILAGSKPGQGLKLGTTPVPDLNFTSDPEALRYILEETDIPLTAMLFEVTSTTELDAKQIASLRDHGPAGRYFAAASEPNVQAFGPTQPFDANVVYHLAEPKAYRCFESGFRIVAKQPSADPDSGNIDAFRPDLPGRRVEACDAFARPGEGARFIDAVLDGVRRP